MTDEVGIRTGEAVISTHSLLFPTVGPGEILLQIERQADAVRSPADAVYRYGP